MIRFLRSIRDTSRYQKNRRLRRAAAAAISLAMLLSSCSGRIGWGVVLWTVEGTLAKAGAVVPVYLKSNITKVYVIGIEGQKERLEVPLWQVAMFKSKRDASKRSAAFGSLVSTYLVAERDGLPLRESPSNTADRVYRMHEREMVKALEIVEGEELYTGGTKLPGNWYKVLAGDGTEGFAFSYAMEVFDETTGKLPDKEKLAQGSEATNELFSNAWRPAWYTTMLSENLVDLDYFSLRFGLFGDAINRQIRVELPRASKVFQYSSITEEEGWLKFGSTDLKIKLESPDTLLAVWNGENPSKEPEETAGWNGDPGYARFIAPTSDIREAIRAEEARRGQAGRDFFALAGMNASMASGAFAAHSDELGELTFWPGGGFAWKGSSGAPAGFAPELPGDAADAGLQGSVIYGLRLSDDLAKEWQGGFSLYADDTGQRHDYIYRFGSSGITLARAAAPLPGARTEAMERRFGTHTLNYGASR